MRVASRWLLALAAVALVGGLLFGAVPVRVRPVVEAAPAGQDTVSCGSAFSTGSSDDACEGAVLARFGAAMAGFGLCVLCFLLGTGALVLSHRGYRSGPAG